MQQPVSKLEESSCCRHPMDDARWQRLLKDLKAKLQELDWNMIRSLARSIQERIEWLNPIMDRYCEAACGDCGDPCCHGRRIFFNRTDMLYLAALEVKPPPGQTRVSAADPCRYLTADGCSLPRTIRPYVCVWFLCEAHMAVFQEEPAAFQRRLIRTLEEIRSCRLALESTYERYHPGT